jgi:hypothetical protein
MIRETTLQYVNTHLYVMELTRHVSLILSICSGVLIYRDSSNYQIFIHGAYVIFTNLQRTLPLLFSANHYLVQSSEFPKKVLQCEDITRYAVQT